jgi:hypothetical protein
VVAVAVQTYLLSVAELVELQDLAVVELEKDLDQAELELKTLEAVAAELNMILRQVAAVPAEKV